MIINIIITSLNLSCQYFFYRFKHFLKLTRKEIPKIGAMKKRDFTTAAVAPRAVINRIFIRQINEGFF
mgnify:CR=1 FL=1